MGLLSNIKTLLWIDVQQYTNRTSRVKLFEHFHLQGKFQLLHPATPYYPFPRGKFHTRGNIWSFTVG